MTLVGDVDPGGFGKAHEVNAAVLKEPAVLDSEHCVHQNFRHLVVMDHLPLRALIALEKGRHHFRFEFVCAQLSAGASRDALDMPVMNANGCRFRTVIGTWAGLNL